MKTLFLLAAYCSLPAAAADMTIRYAAGMGRCELTDTNAILCDAAAQPMASASNGISVNKSAPAAGKVVFSSAGIAQQAVSATYTDSGVTLSWSASPAAAPPAVPVHQAALPIAAPTPAVLPLPVPAVVPVASVPAKAVPAADPKEAPSKAFVFDYSIPDSPGFVVLGMTPENVTQPRTLRELAVSVKNGVDQSGKLKSGVAIDFIPAQLMGDNLNIKQYMALGRGETNYPSSMFGKMLYNTSVSIATVKGSESDDKSVKLGIGIHFPIFDDADGRNDLVLIECYAAAMRNALPSADGQESLAFTIKAESKAAASACFKARVSRWNASALTLSAGAARVTDSGKLNETKSSSSGIWASYSYGFRGTGIAALEDHAQFLAFAKAANKEAVADPRDEKKQIGLNSRLVTLGFKAGSEDFNASLNQSWSRLHYDGFDQAEKVRRWSVGLEYKVAKDTWIVAATGKESGRRVGENQSFVNTGLRFGSAAQTPPESQK